MTVTIIQMLFQIVPECSETGFGSINKMLQRVKKISDILLKMVFDYLRSSPDSPWTLPTITKQMSNECLKYAVLDLVEV